MMREDHSHHLLLTTTSFFFTGVDDSLRNWQEDRLTADKSRVDGHYNTSHERCSHNDMWTVCSDLKAVPNTVRWSQIKERDEKQKRHPLKDTFGLATTEGEEAGLDGGDGMLRERGGGSERWGASIIGARWGPPHASGRGASISPPTERGRRRTRRTSLLLGGGFLEGLGAVAYGGKLPDLPKAEGDLGGGEGGEERGRALRLRRHRKSHTTMSTKSSPTWTARQGTVSVLIMKPILLNNRSILRLRSCGNTNPGQLV